MSTGRSFRELLAEDLQDPTARREWERTAVGRALSIWLIRYRVDHDLTQEQLAAKLGLQQSAVGRLEIGETEPRVSTLLRISRALGVQLVLQVERTADPAEAETVVIGCEAAQAA